MKSSLKYESLTGSRVLVTGGTGFIGAALCRTLLISGCKVTVLTRSVSRSEKMCDKRIVLINSLNQLKEDDVFDIIINLAGEPIAQRWTKSAKEKIINSRINTTMNIAQFIRNTPEKPAVFISGSAIGYYGTDKDKAFDETAMPVDGGAGAFAKQVCSQWEEVALAMQEVGVRTVLLRIGAVLEKDGGTLSKLLLPFYFCLGGRIGSGKQWFSWVHRDDLVGIILHIICTPSLKGAVIHTNLMWRQMAGRTI